MQRSGAVFAVVASLALTAGCGSGADFGGHAAASGTDRFEPLTEVRPLPKGHPALPDGHPPIPEAHPVCPRAGAVPQWGLDGHPARGFVMPEIISI